MEDKRFSHIANDPKFRRIPKGAHKVKIGKRFQSMFKDKQFKVKYTVDKRGRPLNHSSKRDLKEYYDLSSSEDEADDAKSCGSEKSEEESPLIDEENTDLTPTTSKSIPKNIKSKLRDLNVDYARGESKLVSESSSDDEESDEELSEGEAIEHKWGELDKDAESTDEATCRLAACNMDWDRIRAIDLMVLFNSFLPPGGALKSVTIYPSEFGRKRLQEEEVRGPIELVENTEENEEGAKYHMEKLRQYQLNRLKYYYAVITCDSAATANKIYTECDGMEYESSATKIDLRFIPDDMEFDDEPKEVCDKLPELNKYQPRFFTTTALQQAKVDLTWDETDPERIEFAEKLNNGKIDEVAETDLQNYVAVSSDDDDSDAGDDEHKSLDENNKFDKNPIDKYRLLLQEIEVKEEEKKNKDIEMEMNWDVGLKDKTEQLVKKKLEDVEEKTPFQKYLDKRKEKRKEKRQAKKQGDSGDSDVPSDVDMSDPYFAEEFNNSEFRKKPTKAKHQKVDEVQDNPELDLLLMNEDDEKSHFSLKRIQEGETQKKRKRKTDVNEDKVDDFEVDVNDRRFAALFTSHLYNIDPTDPHYKKTKGMETLINEKIRRRQHHEEGETKQPKLDQTKMLVKSVQRKLQMYNKKK